MLIADCHKLFWTTVIQ